MHERNAIQWVDLYVNHGLSINKIASNFNTSTATVYKYLLKNGVETRNKKQIHWNLKEVPIQKVIGLYQEGLTIADVARTVCLDQGLVRYILNKNGIETKRRNNPFSDGEVLKLYKQGHSMETIADILNTSSCKVRTSLLKIGADIRHREPYDLLKCDTFVNHETYRHKDRAVNYTKSELKYASNSKIFTDENFFNEWAHELAYFLGWMASDGNITNNLKNFRITSTDIEHLENLFSMFSYGWTVSIRKWKKEKEINYKPAGTIAIARRDIVNKLIYYGITPKKSLTIKMPNVPGKYLRDFVRGLFEGDGCITIKLNKFISPKIVFSSGSLGFLESIGKEIQKQTALKYYVRVDKKGTWTLEYNSPTATEILFHYFYSGVPENMILKRKYDKFIEYFSKSGR